MTNGKHASYFYAIFGITLVLLVLGIAATLIIGAQKISNGIRETMQVEVVLKDSLSATGVAAFQQSLQHKKYVKSVKFISKEEAYNILKNDKVLQKDLGEHYLDILGYNPLYASFKLNLNANYANPDSFTLVKADLDKVQGVSEVNTQSAIMASLDKNVQSATLLILIVAAALLVFAISMIFNTIRLVMFSNRFTIKTMQLFGATQWFIIKPFLGRSIVNGFISGLAASALITAMLFYFDQKLPELGLQADFITFAALLGMLVLFGVFISFFSTLTAVLRYLRMKVEDLY